jgi:hypothetical protein
MTLTSFISSLRDVMANGGGRAEICSLTGAGFDIKTVKGLYIVSPQYNRRDFAREISFDINGLIFDSTGKILALPIPSYNPNVVPDASVDITKYKIQELRDGTTITIYFHEEWKIATTGGIDVGGLAFCGTKTFRECIDELAPDLFHKLSKNMSYTLGFHHNAYHPCRGVENDIWIYAAADLDKINAAEPEVCFCLPEIGLETPATIDISYAEIIARNKRARGDYLRGQPAHFGYILRGDFAQFGEKSACMLPSTLMKFLTKSFYNLPHAHKIKVSPADRVKATCILAVFDSRVGLDFWRIFPFDEIRSAINTILNDVIKQAIIAAGNKARMQDLQRPRAGQKRQQAIAVLAREALALSGKGGSFNPCEEGAQSTLLDCIYRIPRATLVEKILPII